MYYSLPNRVDCPMNKGELTQNYFFQHIESGLDLILDLRYSNPTSLKERYRNKYVPELWAKLLKFIRNNNPYTNHVDTYLCEDNTWRCQVEIKIPKGDIPKTFSKEFDLLIKLLSLRNSNSDMVVFSTDNPSLYGLKEDYIRIVETFVVSFKQ